MKFKSKAHRKWYNEFKNHLKKRTETIKKHGHKAVKNGNKNMH